MSYCTPNDGGCWFCLTDDKKEDGWLFSIEFDTYLHKKCLEYALEHSDDENCDVEADIIGRELGFK